MSKRNRTRDYYRKMRKRAIHRKERIINSYRPDNPPAIFDIKDFDPYDHSRKSDYGQISPYWYVKHKGELAKGKIHCSCELCSYHDTPIADKRRLMSMSYELSDCLDDENALSSSLISVEISRLNKRIRGAKSNGCYGYSTPSDSKEDHHNGYLTYVAYSILSIFHHSDIPFFSYEVALNSDEYDEFLKGIIKNYNLSYNDLIYMKEAFENDMLRKSPYDRFTRKKVMTFIFNKMMELCKPIS